MKEKTFSIKFLRTHKNKLIFFPFHSILGLDLCNQPTNISYMKRTVMVIKNNGKFGGKLPNGTLTGALGSLQRRKSDIAMTAFFLKVISTYEPYTSLFLLLPLKYMLQHGN